MKKLFLFFILFVFSISINAQSVGQYRISMKSNGYDADIYRSGSKVAYVKKFGSQIEVYSNESSTRIGYITFEEKSSSSELYIRIYNFESSKIGGGTYYPWKDEVYLENSNYAYTHYGYYCVRAISCEILAYISVYISRFQEKYKEEQD